MSNQVFVRIVVAAATLLGLSLAAQAQGVRIATSYGARPVNPADLDPVAYQVWQDRQQAVKVLAAAQSQKGMSQAALAASHQQLSSIKTLLDDTQKDSREAQAEMAAIEAKLAAAEKPDSELGRAVAALDVAKTELQNIVKRLTGENAGARLSPAAQKTLDGNYQYLVAKQKQLSAGNKVIALKSKLYQADADWVASQKDYQDARRLLAKGHDEATTAGLGRMGDKFRLRSAKTLEAEARWFIDLCDYRLGRLGYVVVTGEPTYRSRGN